MKFIIEDISNFYYELQHIERKINKYFDLIFNPTITSNTEILRTQLWNSLNVHIPGVLIGRNCKSPETIIFKIDCLIKELN